jgi:hypothetical protein
VVIGITIGLLIGSLSGFVVLVMINTARGYAGGTDAARLIKLTTAVVCLWFGTSWGGTRFLDDAAVKDMRDPYFVTLAVTFLILASRALLALASDVAQGNLHLRQSPRGDRA